MKKISFIILLISLSFVITGCDNKQSLKCSKTSEVDGINVKNEITLNFDNNKVNRAKLVVNNSAIDEAIKENWDVFAEKMEQYYSKKVSTGIKINTSTDKEKYNYNILVEIDFDKASSDELEKYGFSDIANKRSNIDKVKNNIEKDGFKCK